MSHQDGQALPPDPRSSSPGPSRTNSRSSSPNPSKPLRRPASHGRLNKLMLPGRARSGSSASQSETTALATSETASISSGRSTPEQRWRSGKAAAASLLANDAKYKKFVGQIDKCLQAFESVNEWADFISFLSRLLKTLQANSTYSEIPRKLLLSKRLAQCLNPALPSGVHQRALDVYAQILGTIGPDGLRRDLLIWSSGLFPFFQFAATSVRPLIINIFERYYLPLGEDLRPATKAIILSLLPGLEEETGDFFDTILKLFGLLSDAVTSSFFLSTIFLVLISSSASRLPTLNYLNKTMPKPPDPNLNIVSGLIIRAVAATLGDENMLVRRHGLDLLLRLLRLDQTMMREAPPEDRVLLMRATINVVLSREISLSRRVYTWLLSPEEDSEKQLAYFRENALDLLVETLEVDMQAIAGDSAESQRPFKIFLSLLDRWEIGSSLSPRLIIPALEAIRQSLESSPVPDEDLIMTAAAVYEAVEPVVTWKALFGQLERLCCSETADRNCLMDWVLQVLPQKDTEVREVHAPAVLESVLDWIEASQISQSQLDHATDFTFALLGTIPASLLARARTSPAEPLHDSLIAETLYRQDMLPNSDLKSRIVDQTLPRIIRTSFKLTSNPKIPPHAMIKVLEAQAYILDSDVQSFDADTAASWWDSLLLEISKFPNFAVLDSMALVILRACRSPQLSSLVDMRVSHAMEVLLDALFRQLRPEDTTVRARCMELIWECNQLAGVHALEDVIARRLASPHRELADAAMQSFGILFRNTDDIMLPGEIFHIPLCRILDGLRGLGEARERSETWLRNFMGSYFRVTDPFLARLVDPASTTSDVAVTGPRLDVSVVIYALETLQVFGQFGGSEFFRACSMTNPTSSPYTTLTTVSTSISPPKILTYLDLAISIALRYTSPMEPNPKISSSLRRTLAQQARWEALDFIHLLISHGDPTPNLDLHVRASLLDLLKAQVDAGDIILQSKLLNLLRDQVRNAIARPRRHQKSASSIDKAAIGGSSATEDGELDLVGGQTILRGIAAKSSRPILREWTDFAIAMLPRLRAKQAMLMDLVLCLTQTTEGMLSELRIRFEPGPHSTTLTEVEPILLLDTIERVSASLIAGNAGARKEEDARGGNEAGGLFGLVSGVFVSETPAVGKDSSPKSRLLDQAVRVLLLTWTITSLPAAEGSSKASQVQIYTRLRSKARSMFEGLFKAQPSSLLETIAVTWGTPIDDIADESIFDVVDMLTLSAQRVVQLLTDIIINMQRTPGEARPMPAPLAFLEAYISRLEAPIALQIWNTTINFAKEMMTSTAGPSSKIQLYPVLKCVIALAKIVATTSALEDRRLRRDLQDVVGKTLEGVIATVLRQGDTVLWSRSRSETSKAPTVLASDFCAFLAHDVLPQIRIYLHDSDRIASVCSTVSSSIVSPGLKHPRPDSVILSILREMSRQPAATKAWRLPVSDAFNDAKFFSQDAEDVEGWKPLVCALMDNDKERFAELLARITAAPSANIFVNREQETITRSTNIRRLSFVLLAAEQNHYLTDLPAIQETLVDILRTSFLSPRVHSDVYLCLRVLMCRIGAQHLNNFWPVILAELLRVFEELMDDFPTDGSESLHLVLASCKFLDLLLVMQSEDFQIHQWMFVTDTIDAEYPPNDWTPDAIMDRLAEIVLDHTKERMNGDATSSLFISTDPASPRRPRLSNLHQIQSLTELQPFFSRASIDTYEGIYQNAGVDWDAIEEGLNAEMFEPPR